MKRFYLVILAFLLLIDTLSAQTDAPKAIKYEMRHQRTDRSYWLYIPENLRGDAPLVFVLHGYSGKAEGYQPEMMAVARKFGFAVCYPQGAKDARGKNCWNVGYPFQDGLKTDDVDFICKLAKHQTCNAVDDHINGILSFFPDSKRSPTFTDQKIS